MRRVYNRSRYLSIGEVWLGAMIQRYMVTGRFDTSNSSIWEIATKDSWGETNVFRSNFFLNEKFSIFSTKHRLSWQIWPPVFRSYLRALTCLQISSRCLASPGPQWVHEGKGKACDVGFAIDNNETCCINDGKPAIPTKTTSQSTNWWMGCHSKQTATFLYRCFLFFCYVNFNKWADVKKQLWL